jgi:hypothetical protein
MQSTSTFAYANGSPKVVLGLTLLLIIAGALVVYKGAAALAVIAKVQTSGTFQPRTNVVPISGNAMQVNMITRSINYFLVIWPALLFGILISAWIEQS